MADPRGVTSHAPFARDLRLLQPKKVRAMQNRFVEYCGGRHRQIRDASPYRTLAPLSLAFLLLIARDVGALQRQESNTIATVIENVRANEALYGDFEAVVTNAWKRTKWSESLPQTYESFDERVRAVAQGGRYYQSTERRGSTIGGDRPTSKGVWAFDGVGTKVVFGSAIVNRYPGRVDQPGIFRPHTWMIRQQRVNVPLSVYLTGKEVLKSHKLAGYYKDQIVESRVVGNAMIDGLNCVRVLSERRDAEAQGKQEATGWMELWLAIDRNYLPVRKECFARYWSDKFPLEVSTCNGFRELAPGIWIPTGQTTTIYSERQLKVNKVHVVSGEYKENMEKYDSSPAYGPSLFSEIESPPGAMVYDVKNGKVTSSHKAPSAPEATDGNARWRYWLLGAASFLMFGGVVAWKRRWAGS